jgi:hypothetical protein
MGTEDDADRLLVAVAEEARADVPAVVDRTLTTVMRAVPSYGESRRPGDLDDFRSGFRRSVELALACLVDDRAPTEDELWPFSLIGAQRARQGIPAEDVLAAVEVARGEVLDVLLARAGEAGVTAATALAAARRLAATLGRGADSVRAALLAGHAHGLEQWFPVGSRQRAVLVDRILEDRWTNEQELARHARTVGRVLGPALGLLVLVPVGKQDHEGLIGAAGALAAALEVLEGAVRWTPAVHLPVIVPVAGDDWDRLLARAEEVAGAHGTGIVVFPPAPSAARLAAAYRAAVPSLSRVAAARREPGLIPLRRLELLRVLAGDAGLGDRIDFVRRVLGPVLALPDAEAMLEILDAWHEGSGRAADVARRVHRHENTVRKRLDRIEALTGLDVQVPADRYELETAVHLHRVLVHELQRLDHRDPEP